MNKKSTRIGRRIKRLKNITGQVQEVQHLNNVCQKECRETKKWEKTTDERIFKNFKKLKNGWAHTGSCVAVSHPR